ncbi:hypothetical protein JNW91_16795 [Micromonospora sp. STR1_7]|uniref:Uncharacterized protein n=1 Tax=Micromonospora parastrephiae TaxID=2806101 RepID=A0ABS1XVS3_9ACTN|nr:hypothetical protein [Micromonospora parastrephiae]MBM0233367.1 hypothetical protein [Micromonospora parastrephiae]
MTEQERVEWQQRLQAAVDETLRRRAARRQLHQDHTAARNAGLAHRNRARLARARAGGPMPKTPEHADDVLTVDVAELRNPDLGALASALARVSGWSTLAPGAALAVGQLAQQAQHALDRRRRRLPTNPGQATPPDGPEAA